MNSTKDRSTRSGLLPTSYPDTGESGDTYDIDVLIEPITTTNRPGSNVRSARASMTVLDTAESGDAHDAEV